MQQDEQHTDDISGVKKETNPLWTWMYVSGLRALIALAAIGIVGVCIYGLSATDPNRANVVIVGILSIASLVILIISTVSSRQMIEIMERQEAEMTGQRKAMQSQLTRMEQQETRMIEQRDIMQGQLDTANRHMTQTKELFDLAERPILVADSVKDVVKFGQPIEPIVKIVNRGKTPATNIVLAFNISRPPASFTFDMAGATWVKTHLIAGGDSDDVIVDNEVEKGSRPLSVGEYEAVVRTEQKHIFVYGQGTYEDLSGNRYDLGKWAFRWSSKYGFVKDSGIIQMLEAMTQTRKGGQTH